MSRRKIKAENEAHKPLIRIERTVYEKATFKLSLALLSNVSQYAVYVKEVTGDEANQDEIVEKGMQRLFDADRGFRLWLQRKDSQVTKAERSYSFVKREESGGALS